MTFLEEEVMICLRSHAEIALDQGKVIVDGPRDKVIETLQGGKIEVSK